MSESGQNRRLKLSTIKGALQSDVGSNVRFARKRPITLIGSSMSFRSCIQARSGVI